MNHRTSSRRRDREAKTAQSAVVLSGETGVDVWEALDRLGVMERAVVFLAYWEDLNEVEAAERLGVSERTVRRHLGRARQKLGRLLI
jgi:RNA polymerase sigma-70 factor (ECF subfamily)